MNLKKFDMLSIRIGCLKRKRKNDQNYDKKEKTTYFVRSIDGSNNLKITLSDFRLLGNFPCTLRVCLQEQVFQAMLYSVTYLCWRDR
jgi:hypothetical protein